MTPDRRRPLPAALRWTTAVPVVALVVLAVSWGRHPPTVLVVLIAVVLIGAVLAAVHHAEVVAHRVGEPYGSLVLAVAVTVIEVALIVTLMVSGGDGTASLARDTVFAAVMITCNGIVGLAAAGGGPARHGGLQRRGHRGGAGHGDHPRGAEHGAADVHHRGARGAVLAVPARLRRRRLAGALRRVRAHPDRAAPRLLPPGGR